MRALECLCRGRLLDTATTDTDSAGLFANLKAATPGIVRWPQPPAGNWICGAGSWFVGGQAGEAGLQRLAGGWPSIFPEIDGAFAMVRKDAATGRISILTDRLGSLHLYAAEVDGCLTICTSSQALAALSHPAWDTVGCREFLATGSIFESRTLFDGIEKLPPASLIECEAGAIVSRQKYWNLADALCSRAPRGADVPRVAAALEDAVSIIAKNYAKPVFDLTGGFDSRAVVGAALARGLPVDTVVNGAADSPDVVAAQRIADEFGLRHRHHFRRFASVKEWWEWAKASLALCDGEYDALLYAGTFSTHSRMAEEFDASVNGSNGEILKGYWWELLAPHTGRRGHFDARAIAAGRFVPEPEIAGLLAGPQTESLVDLFAGIIRRANAGLEDYPNTALLDNVYLTLRMQRWQGRIVSATSHIWPCTSPFAFRGVMEAALATPPRMRVRHRLSRRLIEYQSPKLAALPLAQGYPALPLRLSTAHRFWPLAVEVGGMVARQVRRRLRIPGTKSGSGYYPFHISELWQLEEVRDLLDPGRMRTAGLYERRRLAALLEESRQASFGGGHRVGRILGLEMLGRAIAQYQ